MKELPTGCKLKRYADGCWDVVNDAETHWWSQLDSAWLEETLTPVGNHATVESCLETFYSTYTGQPIPGIDKPAVSVEQAKVVLAEMQATDATAAEKFDLVPPWVTLGNNCVASVSSDLTHWARVDGTWGDCGVPNIDRADVNRIARLTRPLPSWEPAPDCALPVEGWFVQQTPLGRWGIYANGEPALSVHDTRRAAIVWAWTEAEAPDATVATDDLEARVSKVEGVIARITPEADEQVDGKGRTLVEIDAALEDVFEELASYARRTENLERLLAARVSNPCEPSKATGENELATDIMCADRQRFLASVCDSCRAVVRAMLSKGDIPGVVNTKHV